MGRKDDFHLSGLNKLCIFKKNEYRPTTQNQPQYKLQHSMAWPRPRVMYRVATN